MSILSVLDMKKIFIKNFDQSLTRSLLKPLLIYANCDILALYNERIFKQNKLKSTKVKWLAHI